MMTIARMNRRQFFGELGKSSFVIGFSLSPMAASILAQEAHAASLDSQLTVLSDIASGNPAQNDAWLTIDHQGNITLFSGKVEIGTGIQTAFSQIVAEELYVDASMIGYVQGDTSQTPDQGFTAGSKSIQVQGPLVRRAAATAYQQLVALANAQGITLKTGPKNNYAKLLAGQQITLHTNPSATIKDPSNYTVVGQPVARLDLTNKCTGTFPFVSDVVLPGMLHGRVLRNVNGGSATKPKNVSAPWTPARLRRRRQSRDSCRPFRRETSWASSQPPSGGRSRRRIRYKWSGSPARRWCPSPIKQPCRQP